VDLFGAILKGTDAFTVKPTYRKIAASLFDNEFIRVYLSIISGMLLAQISIFLMLLLYVKFTAGECAPLILIALLSLMILIISAKFFRRMFKFAVGVTIAVCVIGLVFHLVPQIPFYAGGITTNVKIIPASTARIANEIKSVQANQQEAIDNEYLNKVLDWQKANPGKEPPQWFKDVLAKKRTLN
jgi:uncharacterized membrane protein YgaE (UPF0421/DUF939 family)